MKKERKRVTYHRERYETEGGKEHALMNAITPLLKEYGYEPSSMLNKVVVVGEVIKENGEHSLFLVHTKMPIWTAAGLLVIGLEELRNAY
jgi:hypothetical protein